MGMGIQVWNADGTLQFDTSNRLMRSIADVVTGTTNGSAIMNFSGAGTVTLAVEADTLSKQPPTITRTGNTLSWDFGSTPVTMRQSARIKGFVY